MSHWATQYIGLPWIYGGQGPDAFDCWGFVRYILSKHFNIEVPIIVVPDHWSEAARTLQTSEELVNWSNVPNMSEGQVVMMARRMHPVHVGLCIEANGSLGVLHCAQPAGVLFQTESGLKRSGWGRLTHYRHISC